MEKYEEQMSLENAAGNLVTAEQNAGSVPAQENGDADQTTEAPAETKSSGVDQKAYKKAVAKLNEKTEKLASKQAKLAEQESIVEANKGVKVSASQQAQIRVSSRLNDMNIRSGNKGYLRTGNSNRIYDYPNRTDRRTV